MDSSDDDNDYEARLDGQQSQNKKAKKRKSRNSSTPGQVSNSADAVAASGNRTMQMERDAQSKAAAAGRRTTSTTVPGAVPDVMEPTMISPTPSTQSRDAAAKRRARRSGAAPVPGAATSEPGPDSYGTTGSMESDLMAKNRARPPPRQQTDPTPSQTTSFESESIMEQRAGLRALEQDLNAKNEYRLPRVDDTVVDPTIRKSLAASSNAYGQRPADPVRGSSNNNFMSRSMPPESPRQEDGMSKDAFGLDSPGSKEPHDGGLLDDIGYGEDVQRPDPGDGSNHLSRDAPYASPGFGPNGEILDGGIEAFVADQQVVDAMGVALVMSDEEQERIEKQRFRRYLWIGICLLILLTAAIVIPVVIVFGNGGGPEITEPPSSAPSASPSAAPTSTRFADILDYARQFSSAESLNDPTSPQYLAADWVANLDGFQADLQSDVLAQRYLLAVFYFSTGGDEWEECSRSTTCNAGFSWLDGTKQECLWHGVRCNTNQQVSKILIGNQVPLGNNLKGTLPSELGYITNMESFVLIKGLVGGTIPSEYGKWSKLTTIFIQDHRLNGTIPEELMANAPGMDMFAFGGNLLTGPIPTLLTNMPVLRDLQLFDNRFTGTIPTQLNNLSATMRNLELGGNLLTGKIPDSIYSLVLLSQLSLDYNTFVGTISTLVGQLTSLEILELNGNQLTGDLPDSMYSMPNLKVIRVSDNRLSGTISGQLTMLNLTLEEFSAANNSWTGEWPNAIFEALPQLETVRLEGTELTGAVSATLCSRNLVALTVPDEVDCSVEKNCCD